MKVACVLITHLRAKVELRRQPLGPPQTRGVHHGARRPPLLLRLPGAPSDDAGRPTRGPGCRAAARAGQTWSALSGAPLWRRTVNFKRGAESWERASFVIGGRLEADHPRAPIDEVTLTLAGIAGGPGVQMGLLRDVKEGQERRLMEAERELQARTGGGHALHRIVEVAPWHPAPEMRAVQVPIDPSGKDAMKPLSTPAAVAVREGPDRQPAAVRLGSCWCGVARIEDLWWLPEPLTRTYYRVSAEDGRQVTLFRDQRGGRWYRQTP